MTATVGASVCVRVCAMLSVDVNRKQERRHKLKIGSINWMLRRGGRTRLTLPGDFKSNRAATVHATGTAAVQQQHNSTSASKLWSTAVLSVSVYVCACSAHQNMHAMMATFPRTVFKIKPTSSNFILSYSRRQHSSAYIGRADDDAPPFRLATPPGFQANHIPKGNLV